MNNAQLAVVVLILRRFDDLVLVAFNRPVQGFDRINPTNLAYQVALDAQLIDKDGRPYDDLELLRDACAYEVNRRVDA